MNAESDIDFEFSELKRLGVKDIRMMPNQLIDPTTKEFDITVIEEVYTTAKTYGVKILFAMPNKMPWPYNDFLTIEEMTALWGQISLIDHTSVVAYEPLNEPYLNNNWDNFEQGYIFSEDCGY